MFSVFLSVSFIIILSQILHKFMYVHCSWSSGLAFETWEDWMLRSLNELGIEQKRNLGDYVFDWPLQNDEFICHPQSTYAKSSIVVLDILPNQRCITV